MEINNRLPFFFIGPMFISLLIGWISFDLLSGINGAAMGEALLVIGGRNPDFDGVGIAEINVVLLLLSSSFCWSVVYDGHGDVVLRVNIWSPPLDICVVDAFEDWEGGGGGGNVACDDVWGNKFWVFTGAIKDSKFLNKSLRIFSYLDVLEVEEVAI